MNQVFVKIVRPLSYSMIFGQSGQLEKVINLESGSKSAKVTVSEKNDDPSPGLAGRSDEGLPPVFSWHEQRRENGRPTGDEVTESIRERDVVLFW